MLEDVQAKVIAEGEAEAKTYSEFACFCKDTIGAKTESIEQGQNQVADLQADLEEFEGERGTCDKNIEDFDKDIETAEEDVTKAKGIRSQELTLYKANLADTEAGLLALEGAIKEMKASKNPAFIQLTGIAKTVRTAALIA